MRRLSNYGPALVVLATAIVVLLAGPRAVWDLTYAHTEARIVRAREGLERNPVLEQINQANRDIAALVEPSVVHISAERTVRDRFGRIERLGSAGSGWIYDAQGHIVTNYHVVENSRRVEVQLSSGNTRPAQVVGFDQYTDIAVLKIAPGRLSPATRATPDGNGAFEPVRQGDLVFAFGSPFDFRFSMSTGVVSGTGRSVGVIRDQGGRAGYENFIQVDAAINRGNSGGPLTDARGRVIGMNTAIATDRGSRLDEGQFAGVGLAIPIDMIEPVVQQLIATGSVQKGYMGVGVLDRGDRVFRDELGPLGFRGDGLVVARVEPDTPAYSAGLRLGDIITLVAGQPVATRAAAEASVNGLAADDPVKLSVWRYDGAGDSSGQVAITLPAVVAHSLHGVELLDFDDTIAGWLSVLGFEGQGVRIAHVEPDKPASRSGLRYRDVVTHVDGEPVSTAAQLRSRISSMLPGDEAGLTVWRFDEPRGRGETLAIEVRLDRLDPLRLAGIAPTDLGPRALEELGIALMATSTPQLAGRLGVAYHPGVLVQEIVEGSALQGRLEPGSVIVALMDQPVTSLEGFLELLRDLDLRAGRGARVRFMHPDGRSDDLLLRLQ